MMAKSARSFSRDALVSAWRIISRGKSFEDIALI